MAKVDYKIDDNVFTILLSGKVDSSNSDEVEREINSMISPYAYSDFVLDVEGLQYISSAGLRVILRLKKTVIDLRIINASSEVYDIFDMTGFVEMMPIEKAYRHISVDGCEVIGQGASGKVYRIDRDTIVKHYYDDTTVEDIDRSRELSRRAFILGVPTAIPYDVVRVNDGFGSVYELLDAEPFAKLIINNPDKLDEYVKYSVDVLKGIHKIEVNPSEIPSKKQEGEKWMQNIFAQLPEDTAKKFAKMYDEIPDSNMLMHGDYHIKNIMMQNGEVLLIDMDTLSCGNPIFEFASLHNAYMGYSALDHNNTKEFFGIDYEVGVYLFKNTLRQYFDTYTDEELVLVEKKVSLLGFFMLIGIISKEDDEARHNYYIDRVIELCNEVDSLYID